MKNIFFKKLVILEAKGRLGNRLQTSAYSLVYAKEHNISIALYCLSDHEDWFEGTRETFTQKWLNKTFEKFCIFLTKHRKISKLLNVQVLHGSPKFPVIFTDPELHQTILSSFITIVKGYYDGQLEEDSFNGLNWGVGPRDVLGDLYTLSLCDFILGPPSTFNRWSAFYGNSPRLEVIQETKNICLNDFITVNDLTFPNKK